MPLSEFNRRRLELSFRHHAEVAALPPDEADRLLDSEGWRVTTDQVLWTIAWPAFVALVLGVGGIWLSRYL